MLNGLRKLLARPAASARAADSTGVLINVYATIADFVEPSFPHVLHAWRDGSDPELRPHLSGFEDYVLAQGDGKMTALRFHVLQHIARVRQHASLSVDPRNLDDFAAWAERLNAIAFLSDGSVRDPHGRVLVARADEALDAAARIPFPEEAKRRKERTGLGLSERGLRAADLPPREGEAEVRLREANDVYGRAQALLAVAVRAESVRDGEPILASDLLAKLPAAESSLSPAERRFLDDPSPTAATIASFGWNHEALQVLEWALGLVEELPFPDTICDAALTTRTLLSARQAGTLRPTTQLLDALDFTYRLHWIAVQARVEGRPAPAGLIEGALEYRHRAFNWLVHYRDADWDAVTTQT